MGKQQDEKKLEILYSWSDLYKKNYNIKFQENIQEEISKLKSKMGLPNIKFIPNKNKKKS